MLYLSIHLLYLLPPELEVKWGSACASARCPVVKAGWPWPWPRPYRTHNLLLWGNNDTALPNFKPKLPNDFFLNVAALIAKKRKYDVIMRWLISGQMKHELLRMTRQTLFFSRYLIKFIWATALTLTIWDIPQLFWVTVTCLDHFVYLNVYFVQNKKANIIFFCIKNIS